MKVAITIPCFGRYDALAKCLDSLRANYEVNSGQVDVLLYPDAQDPKVFHGMFSAGGFRGFVAEPAKQRLRGCLNIIRSIREAFDAGYDRVIRMDSDLQVSPYCVRQLMLLQDFSKNPSQTEIACRIDIAEKPLHSREVVHGWQTGSNFVFDRHQWETIKPMVEEYETKFLGESRWRDHMSYKVWFKEHVHMIPHNIWFRDIYANSTAGMGADCAIHFAIMAHGMIGVCLLVNRAIHVSTHGENYTPEGYDALLKCTLDVLESDATASDFKFIDSIGQ